MNLFKAIGAFFAKIGKWIRDTAWVQPLLIVGGIFGLIFAINPTVNWVSSWFEEGDEVESYYGSEKRELSWDGVEKAGVSCEVEQMFDFLNNGDSSTYKNKFANKFLLLFYYDGCEDCTTNYKGLSYIEKNWKQFNTDTISENLTAANAKYNNLYGDAASLQSAIDDSKQFTVYTINVKDKENESDELTYFQEFIYGNPEDEGDLPGYQFFSNLLFSNDFTTDYLDDHHSQEGFEFLKVQWGFEGESQNTFAAPTCLLFEKASKRSATCISEVAFSFEGSDALDKANTIFDLWTHSGDFRRV